MVIKVSVARKPRADAQRNRERLVAAAKAAFAETGPDASLEDIARRAGVGIGTLYRHFPTRDAVIEAVYRREVEQLAAAATRLLDSHAPGEALHEWLRLMIDYIATKKVVAQAISPAVGGVAALYPASGAQITEAMSQLMARAVASGDIRGDVDPMDLLRGLVGFTYGADAPGWRDSARRLLDVLMDGLKPQTRT
jgi:AcrR family transcriptional regulator